ncbi:MAG: hypothetical protein LUE27_10865, partial [Clostridia bacterium]|nr:hypothetical protein [Clostridia bacterium]
WRVRSLAGRFTEDLQIFTVKAIWRVRSLTGRFTEDFTDLYSKGQTAGLESGREVYRSLYTSLQ